MERMTMAQAVGEEEYPELDYTSADLEEYDQDGDDWY